MLVLAGGVLWYVAFQPENPLASKANMPQVPQVSVDTTMFRSMITNLDHTLAQGIRQAAENGISLPSVGSWQAVNGLSEATISANFRTSPDELWKTFREEGSQAVLGGLAKNAEVTVNNVSTEVMNEARYQYCVGVVNEFERQHPEAAPASQLPTETAN